LLVPSIGTHSACIEADVETEAMAPPSARTGTHDTARMVRAEIESFRSLKAVHMVRFEGQRCPGTTRFVARPPGVYRVCLRIGFGDMREFGNFGERHETCGTGWGASGRGLMLVCNGDAESRDSSGLFVHSLLRTS
jgi:hypothetical protein